MQEEEDFFHHYRQFVALLVSKREIRLLDVFAIDGLEIILHGDDDIAVFAPLVSEFERFLAVGMVAVLVIGNQHEGEGLVFGVAQTIIVHSAIATAVTK